MKYFISSIVLLFFSVSLSLGQDISTAIVQWNSTSTFNPDEGSQTQENTTLTLHGRSRIVWTDATGTIRKSFAVSEIMGEWSSLNDGESLRLEISNESDIGTITITKNSGGDKAVIAITADEPIVYELSLQ